MKTFPQVWPTMLTPFTSDDKVNYASLETLIEWYLASGVDGLFAVCQSSEMFFLTEKERADVARFVCKTVNDRVPVVVSGHISDSLADQSREIALMAQTGAEAVILVSNRLAHAEESEDVWLENLETLLRTVPETIQLGFYECPYPYKRLMTPRMLKFCIDTGRFYFLKDTCCDAATIAGRTALLKGSRVKLYNANSATLYETLLTGADGYSGVMANFQPTLYVWLTRHLHDPRAKRLSDFLSLSSLIETQMYPACAKYHLMRKNVLANDICRACDSSALSPTMRTEVDQLDTLTRLAAAEYIK